MEIESVRERHDHDIPFGGFLRKDARFDGNVQRPNDCLQFFQQTHSLPTSSSNFCTIAASQADFAADLAGFKKGLAG